MEKRLIIRENGDIIHKINDHFYNITCHKDATRSCSLNCASCKIVTKNSSLNVITCGGGGGLDYWESIKNRIVIGVIGDIDEKEYELL